MKYYLHDTNSFQDEKITQLFIEFGYEGLGLFYTILEKIALQEKPVKTTVLKKQLSVGKKLEKCWNFMESLGIICSNNGETFNKQLLNYSENYQIKSEKNKKRISEWRDNKDDPENVTRSEHVRNAPKVKRSKENESKVKVDIENPTQKLKEHLFEDSKFIDLKLFEDAFKNSDYEFCDLKIYYEKVKNWSAAKGAKRNDWIATACNFMLSDKEKNKLILKPEYAKQTSQDKQATFGSDLDKLIKARHGHATA